MCKTTYLSYGIENVHYYFQQGQLAFIYEIFRQFAADERGNMSDDSTELNFIGRYHFHNDKMIDEEMTGHNRLDGSLADREKILFGETRQALSALNKKRQ